MRHDLSDLVHSTPAHASLHVGADLWRLYIFGLTRVGHDIFMQVALIGPRICTVTVRAVAPIGNPATARRVINAVHAWLQAGGDGDQAYLELTDAPAAAC